MRRASRLLGCFSAHASATTVVSTSGKLVAAVADDAGLYVAISAKPLGPSHLLEIAP
jgi:hypothetical protein